MRIAALLSLLLTLPAGAASFSINPVADAFVTAGSTTTGSGNPSANYGAAGALQISAASSSKGEIQTLFKFDLASTKTNFDSLFGVGQWVVQSVKLELGTNFGTQGVQPNNAIFNTVNGGLFNLTWQANDTWGEGTGSPASNTIPANPPIDGVTFNSLASLQSSADRSLGNFTYTPAGDTSASVPRASYNLGLDGSFVGDLSAGNLVSLRGAAADSGVSYLFNSRTYNTAANFPQLTVTAMAVPEPATGVLWLSGIAGLCTWRRRHARFA